jgi:hypothetical protein
MANPLTLELDFALWDESAETAADVERVLEKQYETGITFRVVELEGPAGGNPLVEVTWPDEATKARFMAVYDPDGDLADCG